MTAIVVHETLREACKLQTDIKWPNDILHSEKKLCGILAETVETSQGRAVVVGIGINLSNDAFPPELTATATSVAAATGREPDLENIFSKLQERFVEWYGRLSEADGAAEIVIAWSLRSTYATGKRVRIADGDSEISGTTRGLEAEGALRVETENGGIKIVRAGDVSVRPQ